MKIIIKRKENTVQVSVSGRVPVADVFREDFAIMSAPENPTFLLSGMALIGNENYMDSQITLPDVLTAREYVAKFRATMAEVMR